MSSTDPAVVLGPDGAVARRLASYEHRPEQLQMAEAVANAIDQGRHLMVEAGTGVGKSFAYLVPAIMAAVDAKKKVVVSTHTISLQEQLLQKDIPFLRAVMPHEFSAVLVKGRSNYISLRRLDGTVARSMMTFTNQEEFDQIGDIRLWAGRTEDGSRSDLEFRPLAGVWDSVASEDGNCLGKQCPRHNDCFYFKARRRMRTANVLIVNHALFMTDLALRAVDVKILPDYDVAVFDEAHTLEAVAGEHLGLRVGAGQVDYLLNKLYNERSNKGLLAYHKLERAIEQVQETRNAAHEFYDEVADWRQKEGGANGRIRRALDWPDTIGAEIDKLAKSIELGVTLVGPPEQKVELEAAQKRCEALATTLRAWQRQEIPESVYWVEVTEGSRPKINLACAPLDVGPTLRRDLFERVKTCILTSATLSIGTPPSFDFYKSRLGLTRCETLQLGSPFDYPKQVTVHLPRNLPDPGASPGEFEQASIGAIKHYLAKSHGKAFVLFTSYRQMAEVARALTPWLAARNIALFSQSDGMPRSKMVEAFKEDVDSVIFGVDSFWQGVDVPGEALSNVIIVRLPFSVPSHPLLEARLEEIKRLGGNPFVSYQVPEAVIKLKQGFGRLIRSKTDRGIVAILDPRILSKPYGRTFLNSLPNCPRMVDDL